MIHTRHTELRPFQSFLLSSEIIHTISAAIYGYSKTHVHVQHCTNKKFSRRGPPDPLQPEGKWRGQGKEAGREEEERGRRVEEEERKEMGGKVAGESCARRIGG
jgi:hypothetical protein